MTCFELFATTETKTMSDTETPETDAAWAAWATNASVPARKHLELCRRLERERDEARREAEIERDKHHHPDHGGHRFPWEKP